MPKETVSFRLDDELSSWLETTAEHLRTSRTALFEDAIRLARATHRAAAINQGELWKAIAERYGEEAELAMWVTEAEMGPEVRIRVNGEEPIDMRGTITIDPARGTAHVFLDLDDWSRVSPGSEYFGDHMYASLPMFAAFSLPWPPDEKYPAAVVVRAGDVIHGFARAPEHDPAA